MKKISIIVAIDDNGLIGKKDGLPWRLPADLRHFKLLTTGHTVIMGRKTFESIGKPLPNRLNVVVSRTENLQIPGCTVVRLPEEALHIAPDNQEIFVMGGAEIYSQFLPLANTIYLTRVYNRFEGDIYFPPIDFSEWQEMERQDFEPDDKNHYKYSFIVLKKITRN